MALKCKLNPPPPLLPANLLRPGQLIKLIQGRNAGYGGDPPPGSLLAVSGQRRSSYWPVQDLLTGSQFTLLEEGARIIRPTKREAQAYRDNVRDRLLNGQLEPYQGLGHNVGTDPEIFAIQPNGQVIPAWEFLPDKGRPLDFGVDPKFYSGSYNSQNRAFWDGFQAEFTVRPWTCLAALVDFIQAGLKAVRTAARKKFPEAELTAHCVLETPPPLLAVCPEEGVRLGCDPSYNAYSGGSNPALMDLNPLELPFRFAGLHIHLGCGELREDQAAPLVKVIDKIAGVASVLIFRGLEDARRRQYYGLAGEYRLPSHGLEYRVISSWGLAHPVLTHLVFDLVRMSHAFAVRGYGPIWECTDEEAQQAINGLDYELAGKIIERNRALLTALLRSAYRSHISNESGDSSRKPKDRAAPKAERLIFEGAAQLLDTSNLAKNWKLHDGETWERHSDADRVSLANWEFKE